MFSAEDVFESVLRNALAHSPLDYLRKFLEQCKENDLECVSRVYDDLLALDLEAEFEDFADWLTDAIQSIEPSDNVVSYELNLGNDSPPYFLYLNGLDMMYESFADGYVTQEEWDRGAEVVPLGDEYVPQFLEIHGDFFDALDEDNEDLEEFFDTTLFYPVPHVFAVLAFAHAASKISRDLLLNGQREIQLLLGGEDSFYVGHFTMDRWIPFIDLQSRR